MLLPRYNILPRYDLFQILLRGRHVFMGYLNCEQKTVEAIDDEGWLHTGDVGRVDRVGPGDEWQVEDQICSVFIYLVIILLNLMYGTHPVSVTQSLPLIIIIYAFVILLDIHIVQYQHFG